MTSNRQAVRFSTAMLALLLLICAFLRFWALNFGASFHPDERHMIMVAERLNWSDPNPHSFAYGSFPYYLLWLVSLVAGKFSKYYREYDGLFIVGRSICAVFGTLGIWFTYLLARQVSERRESALLAAALLGLNVFHLQLSRFYTVDVVLTTLCTLALYCAARYVQRASWRWLLIGALVTGLAIGSKISALALGLPWLVALGAVYRREEIRTRRQLLFQLLTLGVVTILTFAVVEPYAFLDFAAFYHDTKEQTDMVKGLWRPPYIIQYEHTLAYLYPLKQILVYTVGWPVAVLGFAGVLAALYRQIRQRKVEELIALAFLLPFFLLVAGMKVKFPRYLLPIYPLLFIFAADLLFRCARAKPQSLELNQVGVAEQQSEMPSKVQGRSITIWTPGQRARRALIAAAGFCLSALAAWALNPVAPINLGGLIVLAVGAALMAFGMAQEKPLVGEPLLTAPPVKQYAFSGRVPSCWTQRLLWLAGPFLILLSMFLDLVRSQLAPLYWFIGVVLLTAVCLAPFVGAGFKIDFVSRVEAARRRLRALNIFEVAGLLAILGLAVVLRTLLLTQIPWAVHGDEGEHARIAAQILSGGRSAFEIGFVPAFYPGVLWQAVWYWIFGGGLVGIRAASAIAGTLAVVSIFVCGWRLYGKRSAFLAALFLCSLPAQLWLSRVGLSAVLGGVFALPALLCVALALEKLSKRLALLAGISLALSWMVTPDSLALYWAVFGLIVLALLRHPGSKGRAVGVVSLCLALGVLFGWGPFLFSVVSNPAEFLRQGHEPSIFAAASAQTGWAGATGAYLRQLLNVLLVPISSANRADVWYGTHHRMFFELLSGAVLFGLVGSLVQLSSRCRSIFTGVARGERYCQSASSLLIESVVPLGALTLVLAEACHPNAPSWPRLSPLVPFLVALAARGSVQLYDLLTALPRGKLIGSAVLALILAANLSFDLNTFFADDALRQEGDRSAQTLLVRSVVEIPRDTTVYLFGALPGPRPAYATYYNFGPIWLGRNGAPGEDIEVEGDALATFLKTKTDLAKKAAFVFYSSDYERVLPALKRLFPSGALLEKSSPQLKEKVFEYFVERDELASSLKVSARLSEDPRLG